jgi:hypothetical protein
MLVIAVLVCTPKSQMCQCFKLSILGWIAVEFFLVVVNREHFSYRVEDDELSHE